MSNNFYYNIYSKKTTSELKDIVLDTNSADDSKVTAIGILESRNELNEDFSLLRDNLIQKREEVKSNEIADERYRTFLSRFLAMIIDGLIIGLFGYLMGLFNNLNSIYIVKVVQFISLFLPYFYSILFHGYKGQTIGKMIMNVRIYDKNEKDIIGYKQAFIRDIVPLTIIAGLYIIMLFEPQFNFGLLVAITFVLSFLLLSWSVIEIITMIFNKKRRALHDFIAGTVVLKIKD